MLVLSRGELESIFIGDDIKITVIRIQGKKVRLGIAAPKEIKIFREELLNDDATAKHASS